MTGGAKMRLVWALMALSIATAIVLVLASPQAFGPPAPHHNHLRAAAHSAALVAVVAATYAVPARITEVIETLDFPSSLTGDFLALICTRLC